MARLLLLLGIQLALTQIGIAQRVDSLYKIPEIRIEQIPAIRSHAWKQAVKIPAMLTAAGLFAMTDNDVVDRFEVREERNELIPKFRTHIDDYLQYAPIVATYGLNLAGVKGENNFGNRTALLVKSELLMATVTFSLKKLTAVPRPDTGTPNSFPSGHTAQAFAAATFMAKEYGKQNKMYAVGAYAIATGIGTLRVMNNRHWVSDVVVGAAVGILSTNIVYLTHKYKWGGKPHKSTVIPMYTGTGPGLYFSYKFD